MATTPCTEARGSDTTGDNAAATAAGRPFQASLTSTRRLDAVLPLLALGLLLAVQLFLVFTKSFNWDEFLHFSQVHQAQQGTLVRPFQVLHSRLLFWAPLVSGDLIVQMQAARLFVWSAHILTLLAIFGLARLFVDVRDAIWAPLAYLGAGYVFTQGFSIRADPMAAAALMSALYLFASRTPEWGRMLATGALIGVAGMMTLKAVFYAPCFAGVAWLHFARATGKTQTLLRLAAVLPAALASFGAIYLLHRSHLAPMPPQLESGPLLGQGLRWFSEGIAPKAIYIKQQILLAPVFVGCLLAAPLAWKAAGLSARAKTALASFCLPLLVMLVYRNTFPYFFVFILAPVAVAVAPALAMLRKRFGSIVLAVALSLTPLFLAVKEQRDVLDRQRALIGYVHDQFPAGTAYMEYAGMIADYPRVLDHLTSGIGIAGYYRRGVPIVGRRVDAGDVPFIIANNETILHALVGDPIPRTFLPDDVDAMAGHYAPYWNHLWLEGVRLPIQGEFTVRRGGNFTLSGASAIIDGRRIAAGTTLRLDAGSHTASNVVGEGATLWRGDRLPSPPLQIAPGALFTHF